MAYEPVAYACEAGRWHPSRQQSTTHNMVLCIPHRMEVLMFPEPRDVNEIAPMVRGEAHVEGLNERG